MKKRHIILLVGIYSVAAIISFLVFSKARGATTNGISAPVPVDKATGQLSFDQKQPKTEPCPLNGELYSKQQKDWWEKHRPLGVMIENHENARPQSGLSLTDVVYEAVAEGGITRFLSIFYCQDAPQVGPIRSARTYFLDFISEYGDNPLYVHVGGANRDGQADALAQIEEYGWGAYNDMNQFSIGFPTFWRDYDRLGHSTATEHTMYSTTTKLWDFAKKSRKLSNVDENSDSWNLKFSPYVFTNGAPLSERPASEKVHLELWEGYKDYAIDWIYDKKENEYKRENGGKPHIDQNNKKQLTTKNLVVLYMAETQLNDEEHHLLYKTKGTGKAVVFMNGKELQGRWKKDGRTDRLIISDTLGKPVTFIRGRIWFTLLPLDGVITVK
ncbi:MAG: DUF3048 domain-containing protein [Candidatus Levybacteria bacterium]|nr:DUF3048 domain-containing protein [Candidatus Levybacteria bacterium]